MRMIDTMPVLPWYDEAARSGGAVTPVILSAGDTLFREGDPAESLYYLHAGEVEVWADPPGGAPHCMKTLTAGAVIGECGVLADQPRTATIVARTDAELWQVTREDFLSAAEAGQAWAIRLLFAAAGELANRLRAATQLMESMAEGQPQSGDGTGAKRVAELQRLHDSLLEWSF